MKTLKLVFFILLFSISSIHSQQNNWWWAYHPYTLMSDGYSIATDEKGNSYVTGFFYGTNINFGSTSLTGFNNSQSSVFVLKYDTAGNIIWANEGALFNYNSQSPGTCQGMNGNHITLDNAGHCYVTGIFCDSSKFNSDTIVGYPYFGDEFIAKYDTNGQLEWLNHGGGVDVETSNSIAVDSSGNSYITGSYTDTAYFGNDTLLNRGLIDVYIISYDSQGNQRWIRNAGGIYSDEGMAIVVDRFQNVYVTGYYFSKIFFGNDSLVTQQGDIFLAKYDISGNLKWVKSYGGKYADRGNNISADRDGNIYITGVISDSALIGNQLTTSQGICVIKFDSTGVDQWIRYENTNNNLLLNNFNSLSTDEYGNSYITGRVSDTLFFPPDTIINQGAIVLKLDPSGHTLWINTAQQGVGRGVSFDNFGNAYVTGGFHSSMILGNITLLNVGADVFTAKIGCIAPNPEINVVNGNLHTTSALSYQWYLNGNLLTGANSRDFTPPADGNYVVMIIDTSGCLGYSDPFFYSAVNVTSLSSAPLLSILPNPSQSTFNFNLREDVIQEIKIYDQLGNTILKTSSNSIDLSSASTGLYYFEIKAEKNKCIHGKLIRN
jgi:hypothetical protein